MTQPASHWANQAERGNNFFLNLTRIIVKYCPLWVVQVCTLVVVGYFFLTSSQTRRNIKAYQKRLQRQFPHCKLPIFPVFRQFLKFGEVICDNFAIWQKKFNYQTTVTLDDKEGVFQNLNHQSRGEIIICSHFGNNEISRSLIHNKHFHDFNLNILVHSKHAQAFNQVLIEAGADTMSIIQVTELDPPKMLELANKLEQGEWIAIAVDRVPVRGEKIQSVNFLGDLANFPQGAWFLASILKTPINTIFCLKEQGKYRLKIRKFSAGINGRSKVREENIRQAIQQYADILAQECSQNPLLWFNFFDFWNDYS